MPESPPGPSPEAQAALQKLADVVQPAPISWLPHTWAWVVLAALLLLAVGWALLRWRRRRRANRYRAEALAELARLETQLDDPSRRVAALTALPVLLKRVTLAAWPRTEVARLSGPGWVSFLRARAPLADVAARLLDDTEYRGPEALGQLGAAEARACAAAIGQWIRGHRVSA